MYPWVKKNKTDKEQKGLVNTNIIKLFDNYGIILIDGTKFLFDLDDISIAQSRQWYKDKDGYLVHSYFFNGRRRFVSFHRVVMNAQHNQYIDHINRNRADNRKCNLRFCERNENDRNRGLYSSNTSGITGVHFNKTRNKWEASITYNRHRVFIGRFDLKDDAIRARVSKEVELFKEFAPQRKLLEVYS